MKRPTLHRMVCMLALLAPLAATANIIPLLSSVASTSPAAFTWTYNLELSADQDVRSGALPAGSPVSGQNQGFGSFLTIFDFSGYVAGTCTSPTGWVCLVQNVGFTPSDVLPEDDAGIVNLTWQYATGPVISGQSSGVSVGPFGAQSTFGQVEMTGYAALGFNNSGPSAGTLAANVGQIGAPVAILAIPEPGSLALASIALVLLGGGLRRCRNAS